MKKILMFLPSIVFNAVELIVIFLLGKLLNLQLELIVITFVVFAMIRISLGGAMHYKDWYRCMIWSALVFLSLFVVAKSGIVLSLIMTAFCAIILTSKGNINDIFMWKQQTKYQDIDDYLKYHSLDTKLLEFEKNLKEKDSVNYLVYKYRFIDNLKMSEMADKLDMKNPRIVERLDAIALALRLYCGI